MLSRLSWQKLELSLQNTRNLYAREHPLSIFQAICKFAAQKAGWQAENRFFFHPKNQLWGNRIGKGVIYNLELIFPGQSGPEIEGFIQALKQHLADPERNFRITALGEPQMRSLASLTSEFSNLALQPSELCLDFITPLPFKPYRPKKRWLLAKGELSLGITKRLKKLFNLEPNLDELWQGVEILPYFWRYVEHRHASKSNNGVQFINGSIGPLYLKGNIKPLLPVLLLCSELHMGAELAAGQGYYLLREKRPFFDDLLMTPKPYLSAWEHFVNDSDAADELPEFTADPEGEALNLLAEVKNRGFTPREANGFYIAKKKGGNRLLAEHHPKEALLQRAVLDVLEPTVDRMLEDAAIGYRRGRSRRTAFKMINQAAAQGYEWVLETDIASCFDSISWERLLKRLDQLLPQADTILRDLIKAFVTCPLLINSKKIKRSQGLLQGSPLSPLLANIYLDALDEAMLAKGHFLIRYADDLLILTKTQDQAQKAHQDLIAALVPLGLKLKPEKTAVRPLGAGLIFLGADLGEKLEQQNIQPVGLRKTLYIREHYARLGVERDTLVVRSQKRSLARIPLRRIDEVVIFGNSSISMRLIHSCSRQGIPVSFCSPLGYYVNTLKPDSKAHFQLAGRQAARHAALEPGQALLLARYLVQAKINSYIKWLSTMRGAEAKQAGRRLAQNLADLPKANNIAGLRGREAEAAKTAFSILTGRIKPQEFKTQKRVRRRKADPFNALLDFAYFLLFCQLNVLVRGMGLNPYLGVLHSHKGNYESLVYDLMEPFRLRMDRMVLRLVNLNIIKPKDLIPRTGGGFKLGKEALPGFLQAFERELALWLVGDPACLQDLLAAQVSALAAWAKGQTRDWNLENLLPGSGKNTHQTQASV